MKIFGNYEPEDTHEYDGPSKSQKKRDMQALQELGEALVDLPKDRLAKLELPDSLRVAVQEAQRMPRRNEAFRRQMQYVGRLMRNVEPAPIQAAIDAMKRTTHAEVAHMHRLERLRDALIEDEKALTQIAEEFPGIEIQRLRQMRKNAIKEHELKKPPRAYREIFKMLRDAYALAQGQEVQPDLDDEAEDQEDE